MARRASSTVNPVWLIAAALIAIAAVAAVLFFKDTVSDPYRTLPPFPVKEFMDNANSLRGNVYRVECVIGDQLQYTQGARLFTVEIDGEPVGLVVPAELRDVNVQKGQRYLFKVQVENKGVLKALDAKKS